MADFASMIEKERERLNRQKEDAENRRKAIDEELETIKRELDAIAMYEAAKSGKVSVKRASKSGRAARGSVQSTILQAIKRNDGLTPAEIMEKTGLKGQSVYNAINNLKGKGEIKQKNGSYIAA